jgi:hypothetical protein
VQCIHLFNASFAIWQNLRNHSHAHRSAMVFLRQPLISTVGAAWPVMAKSLPITITGVGPEEANTTEDLWQRKNLSYSVGWKLDTLN